MKLYGKNPVLERIKANPGSIRKLYLQRQKDLSAIVREAKEAGLSFESVSKAWMQRAAEESHTQGVMAEVQRFEYTPFSQILSNCVKSGTVPVFLDKVTDPQNLGSVLRSLACLGNFSIVIPEYESACINETVLRVANGGENYVKVAKVPNNARAVKQAKEKGIWIAGAVTEGGKDLSGADLKFPLAVVMGSEGKGLRPGVRKYLDGGFSLPMAGAALSFNVATATALFCYEINRARVRHSRASGNP
ncbi:MAG: RNA methyltransferase [Candidatus Omnitrophota bacterium]|jgi:23S rRNA (guanosine2251-2'-O)-methyltransferase